ncbi:MAG: AAA family ATPase [Proteobacteria bacterium]|nr:AAA family ATPase [Pseudomonadota bacterium]MBU4296154.1 AAA family ATPase [Pseudomonadota bacterium]MCG2746776.1 AAA family ATPase [Desulfobulbaceae bacterium]
MINEIYIDNFRCLTNFRIKPGEFQLWLGDNGAGKTSVLDALRCIQRLMHGEHVEDIFNRNSLTTWDKRLDQTIGFSLMIDGEVYKYQLTIEYANQEDKQRIKREELIWKDSTFFLFDGQEAHLYRINWKTGKIEEGAVFPADWRRSVIPTIAKRDDNKPLIQFREEVEKILLIHPVPLVVKAAAASESRNLSEHAENFAQWYRHLLQEQPSIGYKAKQLLEDVLPGFGQLSLREIGESRKLMATFRIEGKDHDFDFMNISSGQRQLIVLYTVLEALRAGTFSTVLIDEPDNFVSMREIQPWLENLNDICDEQDKQALIISHHPEIVNKMARGAELWFSRQAGAHVVVQPFPRVDELSPAEVMARGWENE